MLLALAGVSAATMAQQKPVVVEQVDIIQVQDKYQVITNPFWSNWFFSIGGGASVCMEITTCSWVISESALVPR